MDHISELSPCPFCGNCELTAEPDTTYVMCHGCDADGPMTKPGGAIKAWNTRAASADDVRAVAEQTVHLTAVATLRDDGDGGMEADWLLEGGTSELFEGMILLVADNDPTLCEGDGSAEVYRRPQRQAEPACMEDVADKLVARLAQEFPDSETLFTVECFADLITEYLTGK
jgi:hypothetical protein